MYVSQDSMSSSLLYLTFSHHNLKKKKSNRFSFQEPVDSINTGDSEGQGEVPSKQPHGNLTLETLGDFEGAVNALSFFGIAALLLLIFAEERDLVTMLHSVLKLFLDLHSLSLVQHCGLLNRYFAGC